MPIHDVGYRRWSGQLSSKISRWWMIAETGIRISIKSVWVKRIIFACWLPIFYWGAGFLIFEKVFQPSIEGGIFVAERPGEGDDVPKIQIQKSSNGRNQGKIERIKSEFEPEMQKLKKELENAKGKLKESTQELKSDLARDQVVNSFVETFSAFPAMEHLEASLRRNDMNEIRHTFWTWLLMTYFCYPQATALIFLLGFITPSLIARDIRSRALILYFSRPIGRLEYIFGKMMVPATFLMFITTIPALVLYVVGVFLSPDLSVIISTWDIPIRVLLASIVVILPTTSLALMLSSLTQESRFAAFGWFALWALGQGAWYAVLLSASAERNMDPFKVARDPSISRWSPVSLYNNLGNAQSWIFGFQDFWTVLPSLIILGTLTVFSLFIVYRRVSKSVHI